MNHPASGLLPILAMAPNPWEGPWTNRQQLLSRLAAHGARIVYATGQWHSWQRNDIAWRQSSAAGRLDTVDGVQLYRPPKWLLRFPTQRVLDHVSLYLGSTRLSQAVRSSEQEAFLLKLYHPSFQQYAKSLGPARLVYHAYDLFELTEGWNDQLRIQEDWLLAHADLCIASSDFTAARLTQRSGRCVHSLPNGADVGAFEKARTDKTIPSDLAVIPYPRIGYVGRQNRKIDFPLIAQLASRRPEWHFVLVGPIGSLDASTEAGLEQCRALPNVHELGAREYDQLPPYVVNLDVALMPYRVEGALWTIGGYPLKLHEYLAADRPIVSSRLPSLQRFEHVLAFAWDVAEWENGIEHALNTGGPGVGERVSVASAYDWEIISHKLADLLLQACTESQKISADRQDVVSRDIEEV